MIKPPNELYMKFAIQQAQKNLKLMQGGPFGACIVKGNKILSLAHNTVLKHDATSHAEINAIREASRKTNNFNLSGCYIYSTTEPCPMCFAAIHWARIDVIIYGSSIKRAKKSGFKELDISNHALKKLGKSKIKIVPGFLADDCNRLFADWDKLAHKQLY